MITIYRSSLALISPWQVHPRRKTLKMKARWSLKVKLMPRSSQLLEALASLSDQRCW